MTYNKTLLRYCVLGTSSLVLGLIIYLLFRPNAYVSRMILSELPMKGVFDCSDLCDSSFLKFYFADFLWAFSLTCWLHAIFLPDISGSWICALIVLASGSLYELLQFLGIVNGTGDFIDVFMYATGGGLVSVNILIGRRSKKMKRNRFIGGLLAVLVICMFAFFALGSGESTTTDQGSGKAEEKGNLGDYTVEIKSCRLAKDYQGKDVVIVNYGYTNNAENSKSFAGTFDDQVYQNGVGLNKAYMLADSAKYSADNQMKEIKKGATLDVEVAYELNDSTTDIEVEVKELFSLDDSIVKKTFSIAE